MAKVCLIEKQKRKPKFKVRGYNRCSLCGRPHGYFRYFGVCDSNPKRKHRAARELGHSAQHY
jgi:ribosomal protein S14